jgi:hypothetical protein
LLHAALSPANRITGLLAGLWLSLLPGWPHSATASGEFRRGIAMSHLLAWAPVEPAPSKAFVFPPFTLQPDLLRLELRTLGRTGFDFIRLAVDPGPFPQFEGKKRDQLDRALMQSVELILSSGLSVIVDLHPSDMHPDYLARMLTRDVEEPVFRKYLSLLARTAGLLDGLNSPRLALELMNEPPISPDAWRPMLQAAYGTVRNRAPGLALVLEGGDEATPDAMKALAGFAKDSHVLFSFHYYDPYQFTHQGASWMAARYLADVPYPAAARPLADSIAASAAVIAATDLRPSEKIVAKLDVEHQLGSYRRSDFDRAAIARRFDDVLGWARNNAIAPQRIVLGEYGAKKTDLQRAGARQAERTHWFRDVREEAERHGFPWAVWVYKAPGGFGLVLNERDTKLDPTIVEALGLGP